MEDKIIELADYFISESVRYCAENAEFKEMDVVVKRLVVGSKVLE
jgi:conserved domain protein